MPKLKVILVSLKRGFKQCKQVTNTFQVTRHLALDQDLQSYIHNEQFLVTGLVS